MPTIQVMMSKTVLGGLCGQITLPLKMMMISTAMLAITEGRTEIRCSAGVNPGLDGFAGMDLIRGHEIGKMSVAKDLIEGVNDLGIEQDAGLFL